MAISTAPTANRSEPQGVDKSGSRVRQMFGEIAGRYDLLNRVLSLGVDVYWRKRTVRTIAPCGSAPILDVCTGTGDLAIAYARARGDHQVVVGSDFTREMLTYACRKGAVAREHLPRPIELTFVEADAQQLPFAESQFQIVSVAFGLRNVADTHCGLREMVRVCRPGGRVVVLEFSRPKSRLFGSLYRFYFRHILPRIGQIVSGSRMAAYQYLPDSVGEFPDGEALAEIFRECGLRDVQFTPLTFGIATLYWGQKPQATTPGTPQ